MSKRNGAYSTDSMAVAAYILAVGQDAGLKILAARRRSGPGRFEFVFDDPGRRGRELELKFANSECRQYDDAMRVLKTLLGPRGAHGVND